MARDATCGVGYPPTGYMGVMVIGSRSTDSAVLVVGLACDTAVPGMCAIGEIPGPMAAIAAEGACGFPVGSGHVPELVFFRPGAVAINVVAFAGLFNRYPPCPDPGIVDVTVVVTGGAGSYLPVAANGFGVTVYAAKGVALPQSAVVVHVGTMLAGGHRCGTDGISAMAAGAVGWQAAAPDGAACGVATGAATALGGLGPCGDGPGPVGVKPDVDGAVSMEN